MFDDWLVGIVDMFASEYGWTREYIYASIYPTELDTFSRIVRNRQLANYQMLLKIQHASDPQELADSLDPDVVDSTSKSTLPTGKHSYMRRGLNKGAFGALEVKNAQAEAYKKAHKTAQAE